MREKGDRFRKGARTRARECARATGTGRDRESKRITAGDAWFRVFSIVYDSTIHRPIRLVPHRYGITVVEAVLRRLQSNRGSREREREREKERE